MRRRARVDRNHAEVVKACRSIGAVVADTSRLGGGFPDLVIGYRSKNFIFECKDGDAVPSKRKLTPDEARWMLLWKGRAHVVNSAAEAVGILELETR